MRHWHLLLAIVCVCTLPVQPADLRAQGQAEKAVKAEVQQVASVDSGPAIASPFATREAAQKCRDSSQKIKAFLPTCATVGEHKLFSIAASTWGQLPVSPSLQQQSVRWQI